jgi:hypothetical protein
MSLPKLLCGKTLMQFADPISHRRTVLSVDADSRCCKVSNFNDHEQKRYKRNKEQSHWVEKKNAFVQLTLLFDQERSNTSPEWPKNSCSGSSDMWKTDAGITMQAESPVFFMLLTLHNFSVSALTGASPCLRRDLR